MQACTDDTLLRIAVLVSGSGSNLQAIIDAIEAQKLNAHIALVIASNPRAYGIVRASQAGIKTLSLDKTVYEDALAADAIIAQALQEEEVDLVVLAGYMRKVTPLLLARYPQRIINLHPALLPSFKGAHAIEDAYNAGVKMTGITIHFIDEEYDRGPIIAQRACAIEEGMSLDALEEAIHALEHELYPEVIQYFAKGKVHYDAETNKVSLTTTR